MLEQYLHTSRGDVCYCRRWAENTGFPPVWIKDAAHNSNADNSRQVNDEIKTFLEGLL